MGVQNNKIMDEEASEETAVPSFTPVAELEKTALELSTVKKVQTEKKGRQRLECSSAAWRSPAAPTTFAHLGVHGSGTGGKKCG